MDKPSNLTTVNIKIKAPCPTCGRVMDVFETCKCGQKCPEDYKRAVVAAAGYPYTGKKTPEAGPDM